MSDLRRVAQAMLDCWDSGHFFMSSHADNIAAMRRALAADRHIPDSCRFSDAGSTYATRPAQEPTNEKGADASYASTPVPWQGSPLEQRERAHDAQPVIASINEPVQEPVAYSVGRTLHWHEGRGITDAQLYAAPQQRQPLSDEQIDALFGVVADAPRSHWLRQAAVEIVRKTEAAHGIGGGDEQ